VALKYIDLSEACKVCGVTILEKSASAIGDIDKEAKILKMLNHKNIIKLYHAFVVKNELLLIMEYADGGELIEYVEEKQGLDEVETRALFK
jgi:serine/threonine protein kinase